MQVPLTKETFSSAALLADVSRTLLNASMFSSPSRALLSKQFQTIGPANNHLLLVVDKNFTSLTYKIFIK